MCEVAADADELAEAKEHALPEEYDTASNGNDMLPGSVQRELSRPRTA